ncbi:4a-hydroxytetrahydrobiopterin dehydratase [Leptospira sarikeiensis]|uniref:4a-hydroxytetrahydrobiopterin dehydratase n=1 Tax=Leptospira sarikeiensis TaxID=2484943 RepID=A0A4R9K3V6_9LEPT|nr:4a-hydroxytetrahydrobiopterin dehydratase [Leptospira sarikeiensis]TGL58937.1 4a-hydroxytetrahydrobiopterin dehydratase [Leptospira sarikeiensis]
MNGPIPISIEKMRQELPPLWKVDSSTEIPKIVRVYKLSRYLDGLHIVTELAILANELDHHPDIALSYGSVEVNLYTHNVRGLSSYDLKFAISAEERLKSRYE